MYIEKKTWMDRCAIVCEKYLFKKGVGSFMYCDSIINIFYFIYFFFFLFIYFIFFIFLFFFFFSINLGDRSRTAADRGDMKRRHKSEQNKVFSLVLLLLLL